MAKTWLRLRMVHYPVSITPSNSNLNTVYQYPSQAGRKFDYIVCAHKAINPGSVPPLFREVTDERTTFVIIQNGVGNENPFREAYPKCTILSCVTWVGAIQKTPGVITHAKNEDTQIGLFPNSSLDRDVEKERLDEFSALLRSGGTRLSVEENIQVQRWEKVVWNAAWNPLTTLTMVDTQTWLNSSDEANISTKRLMQEMIDVAKRCGVPLEDGLKDRLFDKVLNMAGVYSSMYVDMREGRPMEVEIILGTALKKAREFDIDVPVLSALYSMIVAVDERLRRTKTE